MLQNGVAGVRQHANQEIAFLWSAGRAGRLRFRTPRELLLLALRGIHIHSSSGRMSMTSTYKRFNCSHMRVLHCSRTWRRFSRAVAMQEPMEDTRDYAILKPSESSRGLGGERASAASRLGKDPSR